MKTKMLLMLFAGFFTTIAYNQTPDFVLSFSAENNSQYVQPDSIKIMNKSSNCDTVLYWPDTILAMYYVGIKDEYLAKSEFNLTQNYPNPVTDNTIITFYILKNAYIKLLITDILGRVVIKSEDQYDRGYHSFRFRPGNSNIYFFTAQLENVNQSIKIINCSGKSNHQVSLEYLFYNSISEHIKTTNILQSFIFSPGDELLYTAYKGELESGILDSPEESTSYLFQFATNIP